MYPVCRKSYNLKATARKPKKKSDCYELHTSDDLNRTNIKLKNGLHPLQSILSSIGASGWKLLSAWINSSNSMTPFCFSSKRSKTCRKGTWKVHYHETKDNFLVKKLRSAKVDARQISFNSFLIFKLSLIYISTVRKQYVLNTAQEDTTCKEPQS